MTPWGQIAIVVIFQGLLNISVSGNEIPCSYTLTSLSGDIRSPNFPDPYPEGVDCQWHVDLSGNVTGVTGIALNFKHYATKVTNSATPFEEDLLIYQTNPSFVNATPVIYRGGDMYISQDAELWIAFSSAPNVTLRSTSRDSLGFHIFYSAVIPTEVCPLPEVSLNSIATGSNHSVGSYMSYYCNSGHRLVGSSVTLCVLKNSIPTWSDPAPECLNTCPEPSIQHGHVLYGDLNVNSSAMFRCESPYLLRGTGRRFCMEDNRGLPAWNSEFPECVIPDCSELDTLDRFPGDLVSPGYGTDTVLGGKTCRWEIRAEDGYTVEVYFLFFDVPENSYVDIYDTGGGRLLIQHRVGGEIPRNVTSRSNKVEIEYHGPLTDATSHRGFYIRYDMGTPILLGQDDDAHGTRTPFIPAITFSQPKPTPSPKVSITYVDDGSSTVKIAVGVAIPVVIMLGVVLGLYLWYRKKYPVRMIIGREFAKFSNPEYVVKGNSTLTLVRPDADEFFNTASRATSSVNLVVDSELGPHYINAAYAHDGELAVDEHQPIDQDEEDRELVKRKKYLFTSVDIYDGESSWKDGDSSSESDSDTESRSGGSQASKKTQELTVVVEPDAVADTSVSTESHTSDNYHSDAFSSFESKFPREIEFPRKTSLATLIDRSRDRRAFTNEERATRRYSFDMCMSARGRSLSAKTPAEFSKESDKLDILLKKTIMHTVGELSDVNEEECAETSVNELVTGKEAEIEQDDSIAEIPEDVECHSYNESETLATDGFKTEDVGHAKCGFQSLHDNVSITNTKEKSIVTDRHVSLSDGTEDIVIEPSTRDTQPCRHDSSQTSEIETVHYYSDDSAEPKHTVKVKEANVFQSHSEKQPDEIKSNENACESIIRGVRIRDLSFEDETLDHKGSETSNKATMSDFSGRSDISALSLPERRTGVIEAPILNEIIGTVEAPRVDINPEGSDASTTGDSTGHGGSADGNVADDSTSQCSTGSHVSGAYNVGNSSPETVKHKEAESRRLSQKSRSSSDSSHHSIDTDRAVDRHVIREHGSNNAGNLDTTSFSSLDPSLLDSSVEISSSPIESPIPRTRFSEQRNSTGQTKKVAAPVFNVEDGSESDASSGEPEDDAKLRKRSTGSMHHNNIMPGIQEESDKDQGQSRKRPINTSGGNGNGRVDDDDDDEEEEEEEEGREFTHDDLLAELSDESMSSENKPRSGSDDHITTVAAGKFVFGEVEDAFDV